MISIPIAHLLVGACPICARTDLHSHPVPVDTMIALLNAADSGEPTPAVTLPPELTPEAMPDPLPPQDRLPLDTPPITTLSRFLFVLLVGLLGEVIREWIRIFHWIRFSVRVYRTGQWPDEHEEEESDA